MPENPNGRGLLDPHELALAAPPEAIALPVELIDPNPRNPRGKLVELDALAENIKRFGLLQPVTVRRQGERYELIGGHRRLAAFARLREAEPLEPQWRTIPAVVRSFDDDDSYLALISAQVHSKAWKPREEAAALELLVLRGQTVIQVGQSVNRSYAWASKRLRVYSDTALSALVQTGRLSTGVAEELLILRQLETRQAYAERAANEGWSQDRARGEVRALRLDHQLADLGRRTRELVDLLDQIEGSRIPADTYRDLWTLHGRVDVLWKQALGEQPKMPTVAEAERAARVTPRMKERADAERQRQKTKRRAKPSPR